MLRLVAATGAAERLAAVLQAAPFACVIIALPAGTVDRAVVSALVAIGQKAGAAMLVEADAALAQSVAADGVHLPACEEPTVAYAAARVLLSSRAIVGVDAGVSRHEAMSLGEGGADYVAFGLSVQDAETAGAADRQLELIGWWAEIFEVPCVAMNAGDPGAAGCLARAGADFVCLSLPAGISAADAGSAARAWRGALDALSEPTSGT